MSAGHDAPAKMRIAGDMIPHVLHAARVYAAALRVMQPGELADALRRSSDAAWYLDPTTMIRPGTVDDIARKQRLLRAAADFVREVGAIEEEAEAAVFKARPAEAASG